MGISTRMDNTVALCIKLLEALDIKVPTEKQIVMMHSLITDIGIIFFKLSFSRHLTKQESACLFWISRGKNIQEISALLSVHKATVKTYFQRIKKKLNCNTMEQAVYEGIRYCYIQPKWSRKV